MFKELRKVATVTSGTETAETVISANGKKITLTKFVGNPTSSAKCCCEVVWDYGGAGEEKLWVISNGPGIPTEITTLDGGGDITGDGTKKLALVLNNGCSSDYNVSAWCEYLEE